MTCLFAVGENGRGLGQMKRSHSLQILALTIVIIALLGGLGLAKGGLYLGKHEGDTLHFADIALRMMQGQVPHVDFVTPIGGLAFWPIAFFGSFGLSLGSAFHAAQLMVALCVGAAAWRVAVTRMSAGVGAGFCVGIVILTLAIVHGEADPAVSVSMHYNRWAWALAYVAVACAVLPGAERGQTLDGILLGLLMTALAMIKVTYFAAFTPAIIVGLILAHRWRLLGVALATGVLSAGILTAVLGVSYWIAYVSDLLTVAQTATRPYPSLPLSQVASAPAYIGGTVAVVLAIVALRRGGRDGDGLVMLLLLPAFLYVTYQNFANDPQWLLLFAVVLFTRRPAEGQGEFLGGDTRAISTLAAAAAVVFALPSFLNLAFSPARHFATAPHIMGEMIIGAPKPHEVYVQKARAYGPSQIQPLRDGVVQVDPEIERRVPVDAFGRSWEYCEVGVGLTGYLTSIAQDLKAQGFDAADIFTADLLGSVWMFGDWDAPRGASPWYYGNLSGLDQAQMVMVNPCAIVPTQRDQILTAMTEAGVMLEEIHAHPLYVLYEIR